MNELDGAENAAAERVGAATAGTAAVEVAAAVGALNGNGGIDAGFECGAVE